MQFEDSYLPMTLMWFLSMNEFYNWKREKDELLSVLLAVRPLIKNFDITFCQQSFKMEMR